jgi:hypothetical protein
VPLFWEMLGSPAEKRTFKAGIALINLCLRTRAIGKGRIWADLIDHLLSHYLTLSPPLPIVISPLTSLLQTIS